MTSMDIGADIEPIENIEQLPHLGWQLAVARIMEEGKMSYLNDEQQDYVSELAKLRPEEKCDCGWYRRGECWGRCYGDIAKGGHPAVEANDD